MKNHKRNKYDIFAEILQTCQTPTLRYSVLRVCNLGVCSQKAYMKELVDKGFIETRAENGHNVYRTTDKGKLLLNILKDLFSCLHGPEALVLMQLVAR